MSNQALYAITAAQKAKHWGRYAAARYAAKRGAPAKLLILAMSLEGARP